MQNLLLILSLRDLQLEFTHLLDTNLPCAQHITGMHVE